MARPSRRSQQRSHVERPVHYVLSTHWDREWLQPAQVIRHRLVRLLDRTLRDLESGALAGPFTTDGQSIVIDDYLEIRPHRRALVEKLARTGRLSVGPWYVLPEEWLVSGESFVRNLRLGRRIARDLGATPSSAGFACDLFGHIGQLPQIFAGFGIRAAFIWRGIEPRRHAHFRWVGSDGTVIPTFRFGRAGYGDYAYEVRRGTQPDAAFDEARSRRDHVTFINREAARTAIPPVLIFDGCDHLEYDPDHYRVLRSLKPADGLPGAMQHSSLDAYIADLLPHVTQIRDTVRGELREYARAPLIEDQQWLIPGVLTSRVRLKHANAECQTLLCHWAEPFGLLAQVYAGGDDPTDFLDHAWRWLLQNHPHDSIGGCSIDAVHDDMKYRFAQCQQVGERVCSEALRLIAASVEGEIGEREIRVLVANPLTRPVDETVELTLQIPADWQCFNEFFGFEPKPGFRIYTADGRELPYQRLAQAPGQMRSRNASPFKFPHPHRTNDVTVALSLPLPALGYTTLTIREGEVKPKDEIVWASMLPTRHPAAPGLATSDRSMANEHLAVTIESNGSLTLFDKQTRQTYRRLLTFEDSADIGDGWYHGQAVNEQVYVSTATPADVALLHDGPLLTRFRVRVALRVPAEFNFERMIRSSDRAEVVIDSLVTLRAGADRVEIVTTVDNTARDHRLRVLFPSEAKATTTLSDGAFDVVRRPISLPKDAHEYREMAVETCPQQTWTSVSDARRGLAIVSSGLLDCCVRDLPERPLALTLLRGTRRTIFTNGEPEGQQLGPITARYWIVPLRGEPDRIRLGEYGVQLGAGLRTAQLARWDASVAPRQRRLPATDSLLTVSGPVLVTSVREVEGAVEVRLYNPTERTGTAVIDVAERLRATGRVTTAQRVDLESQAIGRPIRLVRGACRCRLTPKQIITLRLPLAIRP